MPSSTSEGNEKKRLSRRQTLALPYLVRDANVERACAAAGITKKTFYAWQKDPSFREEFERLQNDLLEAAMATLKANIERACERLVTLLDTESPSIQRQAANDIIGLVMKHHETTAIIERLERLEVAASSQSIRRVS